MRSGHSLQNIGSRNGFDTAKIVIYVQLVLGQNQAMAQPFHRLCSNFIFHLSKTLQISLASKDEWLWRTVHYVAFPIGRNDIPQQAIPKKNTAPRTSAQCDLLFGSSRMSHRVPIVT
jgi:hypothetical protein